MLMTSKSTETKAISFFMTFTRWGVLKVLLLGATMASCSFLGACADISIASSFEIGTLSTVYERYALVKLSNGLNQKSWRQLGNEAWHESAFLRFVAVGSLDASQMNALAAQNNKTSPGKSANVAVDTTASPDLILRLQAISTTLYQMSRSIPGTGNIEASMWTIMFSCGSTSCSDGYMVPILSAAGQDSLYSYVTAWLPVTDGALMNAIPASISRKGVQTIMNPTPKDDRSRLSTVSKAAYIQHDLPRCPEARVHSFRTLLDSAYGLAPAIACLGFSDDDSFKIVVTSASVGNGSPDDNTIVKQSLESLSRPYGFEWPPQPFEECSQRPLLILPEEGPRDSDSLPHMCHHKKCMIFFPQNQTGSAQFFQGLERILQEGSSQCISMGSNITTCDSLYNISRFYYLNSSVKPFPSSFRSSDWASEQGKHTIEFDYAPHRENLTACAIELTTPSSQLNPPKEIEIQAIDYLTAYISEHNTAFTTAKGPATDPYTFYALLITTALSVITIAMPFTNFMLGTIVCHLRPFYFNTQKARDCGSSMASKVIIQVLFNVVLTAASFLPVLSLARNEMDRQIEFSTWALASDDLVSDDLSPAPIRVVYLFAISSQYHSKFLVVIVLVICLTCLPIAVCTVRRCMQVFARYQVLLLEADTLMPQAKLTTPSSAIMLALKAIEMGDAEYLELKLKAESSPIVRVNRSKSY